MNRISNQNDHGVPVIPSFNSDSAYSFIEKQLSFGPRVPNLSSHQNCADFLVRKLADYGADVTVQEFEANNYAGEVLHLRNIIASYFPEREQRILLATHWDSRPFADKDSLDKNQPIPGANDGASGTAVLLEVARIMGEFPHFNTGVDLILFDGEDYGEPEGYKIKKTLKNAGKIWWCLGSQHWSVHKHLNNYKAEYGILVDMVGARDALFYKEGGSMQFARKLTNKIWRVAKKLGHDDIFINKNTVGITDDHIFVNKDAKIPMASIIQYDPESDFFFPSYHHTHQDNISLIDKKPLQAVGETLIYLLYTEE
ncbi:MAG: M28 family peptidase [Candidatus Cyclobacteriaceae bacterium M3_2C_046]